MAGYNEENRFGSARWATPHDIRKAGLLKPNGTQIGYWRKQPMYLSGDAPIFTCGGAGSGKTRDLLSYVVSNSAGQRMLVVDPRGELSAISRFIHTLNGEYVYDWNPMGIAGRPSHSVNPFDILNPKHRSFNSDCKMISESLIPLTSTNGKYFEQRARDWLENIIKCWVENFGHITARHIVRVLNAIESDVAFWTQVLQRMINSRFMSVRRVAGEMLNKQSDSQKEFGSIMGELYSNLSFLDDENLLKSLDGDDFSLSCLCDEKRVCKVFFNTPAEYLNLWSPLIRLLFTATMLIKSRKPDAPRILLVVDEAGQLGKFEALMRAVTFGRGAGIRTWTIWQDIGQITRNFDQNAAQTFIGSSQMRQFFGVRDYETAKVVSDMIGMETLYFDDSLRQDLAKQRKRKLVQDAMLGNADPLEIGGEMAQLNTASSHRSSQARRLITPDEIMNMPEDEQIIMISGRNLPPIRAQKYPYFSYAARKEMAGKYLDTPYHQPQEKVRVQHWYGARWHKVIREDVPKVFREFPQHSDGKWEYLDGFYSHS